MAGSRKETAQRQPSTIAVVCSLALGALFLASAAAGLGETPPRTAGLCMAGALCLTAAYSFRRPQGRQGRAALLAFCALTAAVNALTFFI